jgi:hypothetical protein
MSIHRTTSRLPLAVLACILIALSTTTVARAAEAPVKAIFTAHIGWNVNKTKEGEGAPQAERDLCTIASKDECQLGALTPEPGGSQYPEGVAVNNDAASQEHGDLYITDKGNHRVDVLTPTGAFVMMFGEDVDKTTGGDICTAASGDTCQAAVEGSEVGALQQPAGIAIDPSTGDVYVEDQPNWRVDEYTAAGQLIAMFGREVNETKDNEPLASEAEKNICTVVSKDVCKAGVQGTPGAGEHDAFDFASGGDVLTVGGREDLLYVGDENRVQELKTDGTWVNAIPVASTVSSLALNGKTGTLYVAYDEEPVVHEFDVASEAELPASIEVPSAVFVRGMAVDSAGQLAVSALQTAGESADGKKKLFADLYEADGHLINSSTAPGEPQTFRALAFDEDDHLYGVARPGEVLAFTLEPVGEVAGGAAVCAAGPASGTSATFDCTLSGEVNPEGVAETEALFDWGKTSSLGQETAGQDVAGPGTVYAVFEGLRPNETLLYQLVAYDQNVKAPEQLTGEQRSLSTESVPPKVLGAPSVSFVTSASVVFSGELNPENTSTVYEFQYAPACAVGEACPAIGQAPGMLETAVQESAAYGLLGTTAEASGLQPQTSYRYRLVAVNEKGQEAVSETGGSVLPEGTFTTSAGPAPAASTGVASAVSASSAMITGSVDPDGLPATYSFELGVYEGAATHYGDVFSGPAGAGSVALEETLGLTGLQPGTTYAFRIAIHSGYIHNSENTLQGALALFTTAGVPAVLSAPVSLAQLAIPAIAFPTSTGGAVKPRTAACKRGYRRDTRGKCVRSKTKHKTKAAGKRERKRK